MSARRSKVDTFVSRAKHWQGGIRALRSILLDCALDEELKWGKPCFMFEGSNVAIIQPFTGAKQSKTRSARIEKCIPRILAGKGMNDRQP